MSYSLPASFYPVMLVAAVWLVLLLISDLCRARVVTRGMKVGFGALAVLVLFLPVHGVRLWNWAFSFCPNPCLPMLGVVCVGLWVRLFGVVVFRPADWRATWIFGAVSGAFLYLHPMFLGRFDLYYWGWDREVGVVAVAGLAMVFLFQGNRLGVLLLAALIAFAAGALESGNVWDYIIDPLYWITSTGVLTVQACAALLSRRRQRANILLARDVVRLVREAVEQPAVEPVAQPGK
jgi:hypothetical protein